jgi:nitrite reductase/ring-hydroxylating ferredoxin subunit/DMSO/TMAO reductase YedYZ heme-binding membrane subunit
MFGRGGVPPLPEMRGLRMAERFRLIAWTRRKFIYDLIVLATASAFIAAHLLIAIRYGADFDRQALARALGAAALFLVSAAILIGPLARLAPKIFLPALFNRRHLGVIAFLLMSAHVALFLTDPSAAPLAEDFSIQRLSAPFENGALAEAPFRLFGLIAFAIFGLMAATSHDFWLVRLGPPAWKRLHMGVYAAFALALLHVAAGIIQTGKDAALLLAGASAAAAAAGALHLLSGLAPKGPPRARRGRRIDWLDAGSADAIPVGSAKIVRLPEGREAAIFRTSEGFFALSNACSHQLGPLGEGCVRDGYVRCPWHGYEFHLRTGRAPAPFKDSVPAYRLRVESGRLLISPKPKEAIDP